MDSYIGYKILLSLFALLFLPNLYKWMVLTAALLIFWSHCSVACWTIRRSHPSKFFAQLSFLSLVPFFLEFPVQKPAFVASAHYSCCCCLLNFILLILCCKWKSFLRMRAWWWTHQQLSACIAYGIYVFICFVLHIFLRSFDGCSLIFFFRKSNLYVRDWVESFKNKQTNGLWVPKYFFFISIYN